VRSEKFVFVTELERERERERENRPALLGFQKMEKETRKKERNRLSVSGSAGSAE
jgi:hypothetical protein